MAPLSVRNARTRFGREACIAGTSPNTNPVSTTTNDVHLEGRISLYGDLDLDVSPQVTRLLDLPRLLDIPVLSSIVNLWHEIAYEIRLEGTVGSPALRIRALPWLSKRPPPLIQSPHAGRIKRMRLRVLP